MTKKARQSTEDRDGGDNEVSPVQPPRNRPKNNVSRACATCRRKYVLLCLDTSAEDHQVL